MLYWKDKNVFVTGCTGLLGSHLCEKLVESGANVVGLVRDYVPKSRIYCQEINSKIVTVHGNIENFGLVERAVNEYEIDTVFHLAAQTIVSIANRNPLSTFHSNIMGTWNVMEACRRNRGVQRIIAASSDKAYGEQKILPYTEETPLQGKHPYDVSKSCSDLIAHTYYHTYRLPVCITRCGNFYGPGDLNFNRLVPGTIRSVLNGKAPVLRSDGTYIRDYFYVKDGAEAYLYLARKMDELPIHGEAFNFSNELQITVIDLVKRILFLMNRAELEPVIQNDAFNEIKHQYLSTRKAREILGWSSKYALDQALTETIEWYTNNLS